MSFEITPFPLSVPQSALDDLQARLARTRFPDPETVDDASQGPRLATLRALVERWRGSYDWRRAEALLNGLGSHRGLVGVRLNMAMCAPTEEERANATPHEQRLLENGQRYDECYSGYNKVQSTRPQAVGFGVADSPAGLAAWIHSFVQDAAQDAGALDLDELIDDIMMYWLPNAGASAARLYWEVNRAMKENGAPPTPQPAPTGISAFPGELGNLSRRWAKKRFAHLVHFNEPARGGHFAAWEAPDLSVDEVRATFRSLR